ncbi:RNA polymerase sigma factor [Nocardia sp. NBC_00511]|uniref:RNA polymerase sigma factor n=1 Tax=Nocardia sp. NBC_00511 TaxID=2903591 RepID=UPI0030DF6F24
MTVDSTLEDLLRELAPQVLGVLVRRYQDFDATEDAVQEALLAAALQWPDEGVPANPRGWLIQVAQRRYVDTVRSEVSRRNREAANAFREPQVLDAAVPDPAETVLEDLTDPLACGLADPSDSPRPAAGTEAVRDDTLSLFFLCCHPVLPPASAIALTLRAVGGLTTEQIARGFLLPEATMAQRITRAKKRLSAVERPFAPPTASNGQRGEWHERLGTVLSVLYLMYTEGHTTGGPQLHRADLACESIRLARNLYAVLPQNPEVTGLLALLLLTDARRDARTGAHGELIPLAEQDRTLWDRDMIIEGVRLATAAISTGLIGSYQIQAAIAVLHAQALRPEDTDWPRILLLYNALERHSPNPMVTLNRAVATAVVHGPQAGLDLADTLQTSLATNHRLAAVRAHLHEMSGDPDEAITYYLTAARLTTSTPERDYLTLRAAELTKRTAETGRTPT